MTHLYLFYFKNIDKYVMKLNCDHRKSLYESLCDKINWDEKLFLILTYPMYAHISQFNIVTNLSTYKSFYFLY